MTKVIKNKISRNITPKLASTTVVVYICTTRVVDMSKKYTPSDAELEILQVLWEKEPISVRGIHEVLANKKEVGYTTTLKQVQRLYEKGALDRVAQGKSHLYTANYKEKNIKGR